MSRASVIILADAQVGSHRSVLAPRAGKIGDVSIAVGDVLGWHNGQVTVNDKPVDVPHTALPRTAWHRLRDLGAPPAVLDAPADDPERQRWEALAALADGGPERVTVVIQYDG